MATKSQLKQYFKSQKIPTEAQFGTLIDSLINTPSTDITQRPNQNLFFGNGEENPYIQGIRTISKADDNSNGVVNMWILSTYNNNDGKLAVPMLILMRTSTKNPGLLPANNDLRYCIPTVQNIENFVQQGVDCNLSTDEDIFNVVYNWEFKTFILDSESNEITENTVIDKPGRYNVVIYGFESDALLDDFELTLVQRPDKNYVVALLKWTKYVIANGQIRPNIKWYSIAAKTLMNIPYYANAKTFKEIILWTKDNLNSSNSEPNII